MEPLKKLDLEVAKLKQVCILYNYDFEQAYIDYKNICATEGDMTIFEAIAKVRKDIVIKHHIEEIGGLN